MDFPKISESRELANLVGLSDLLSNFCFPEGQKCLAKWTTFVWQIGSDFLTSWATFVSLKVRNVQVNNFCSWHPEQPLFSTFILYATWYTKQLFVFWSFFLRNHRAGSYTMMAHVYQCFMIDSQVSGFSMQHGVS